MHLNFYKLLNFNIIKGQIVKTKDNIYLIKKRQHLYLYQKRKEKKKLPCYHRQLVAVYTTLKTTLCWTKNTTMRDPQA